MDVENSLHQSPERFAYPTNHKRLPLARLGLGLLVLFAAGLLVLVIVEKNALTKRPTDLGKSVIPNQTARPILPPEVTVSSEMQMYTVNNVQSVALVNLLRTWHLFQREYNVQAGSTAGTPLYKVAIIVTDQMQQTPLSTDKTKKTILSAYSAQLTPGILTLRIYLAPEILANPNSKNRSLFAQDAIVLALYPLTQPAPSNKQASDTSQAINRVMQQIKQDNAIYFTIDKK